MSVHGVPRELVTFDHPLEASALDSGERNRLPGNYQRAAQARGAREPTRLKDQMLQEFRHARW